MIDVRHRSPRGLLPAAPASPALPAAGTLGAHTAGQLLRLCEVAGLNAADAAGYAQVLTTALGPVARRPLALPAPSRSFLSDDHTPVEFSLSFEPGRAPSLRVLLEPGNGAGSLARSGRAGLRAVRALARRWNFSTERLDELEDLFFPLSPQGPLALWCALELRPGGVPRVKVYLNPAACGAQRSAETVREALRRLGHPQAFDALPESDRVLFFALDLGDWDVPRVKVYTAHNEISASSAGHLSRMPGEPRSAEIEAFFRTASGLDEGQDTLLDRRPVQGCHAFTEAASGLPGGFTLYVPVRDYVRHDGEALERASALLRNYGADPAQLLDSVAAVTSRRPEDGTGLIAYLALAHQAGRPPRVTVYISSEAYRVRPPAVLAPQAGAAH
ncbi:prenyltransferase [Kitasatospora herbaricolor]|uniref:tryptophan dimethylallyltransferase family protein n=1 Tax=Kitasatospora herbaricolor TaxID=68217 RepID=UPI0019B48013|nr:tryptophan dimethylallyltransferase family protein [Kitasatospora herbaricolor]MDQ0312845.1 DMATS type aromatic prenyltransferase [Kitasatospora herbaricolor]GGV35993.1 prenyltransferase [Kitasatospora herbaricolor]